MQINFMTNETIRQKIREKLMRVNARMESKASDDAKKLGLDYMSFGRWGKDGKVTHKSVKGKLTPLSPAASKKATNTEPSNPNQMIGPDSKVNPIPKNKKDMLGKIKRVSTDTDAYNVDKELPGGYQTADGEFVPDDDVEVVDRAHDHFEVDHKKAAAQLPGLIKSLAQKHKNSSISIEAGPNGFTVRVNPIERGQPKKLTVDVGPISIDPKEGSVTLNGEPLTLSKTESKLLTYLAGNQNKVVSRGTLLDKVWGAAPDIQTRTVDMHVARLKKRLGAAGGMLQNVRGMGYRIVPPKF
jgi:hypothetical protein